jgi:hypothetical protein
MIPIVNLDNNLCTNYQKIEAISDHLRMCHRCDRLSPREINHRSHQPVDRARCQRLASQSSLRTVLEENRRREDDGDSNLGLGHLHLVVAMVVAAQ